MLSLLLPTIRFALSLMLMNILLFGSNELRLCLLSFSAWSIGGLFFARNRHHISAPRLARYFLAAVFVNFCTMVAYNDLFYYEVVGRFLDIFFARAWFELDVPGSGFELFCDVFWRRHGWIFFAVLSALWRAAVILLFGILIPPTFIIVRFVRRWTKEMDERDAAFARLDALPRPWDKGYQAPPPPPPTSDTRANFLRDTQRRDFEDAVSRLRGLSKEFA